MADDSKETDIHTKGDDAFHRAKRMLDAAGIDKDDVSEVHVYLVTDPDVEGGEGEEEGEVEEEPVIYDAEDPDVEYGPVESEGLLNGDGRGGRKGVPLGEPPYQGSLPAPMFEGEAKRPDSIQGQILNQLTKIDEWVTRTEVSEWFDEIDDKQAGSALSHMFRNDGFVKRRKREDQSRSPFEYQTTQSGRSAIREGKRLATKYYQREKEEMEEDPVEQ